jgi:hypothetical protein
MGSKKKLISAQEDMKNKEKFKKNKYLQNPA